MGRVDESQLQDADSYRQQDIQDVIEHLHSLYGGELERGQKFLRIVQLEFKQGGRRYLLKPDLVEGFRDLGLRVFCDVYVTLHIQVEYLHWLDRIKALFQGKGVLFSSHSGDAFLMTGVHARSLGADETFMGQLRALMTRASQLKTKDNTLVYLSPFYKEGIIENLGHMAQRLENLVKGPPL